MNPGLPICVVEPDSTEKKAAAALTMFRARFNVAVNTPGIEDVKQQLRDIRRRARDNMASLVQALKTNMDRQYPQIRVKSAVDNNEAAEYIAEISDGIKIISTNGSSTVAEELRPGLVARGFTVVNSYAAEFRVKERKTLDYWDLPRLSEKNLDGTFAPSVRLTGLPETETRNYLAVLGVNTISARDLTVFFVQHLHNIHVDLTQARKVVLIAGLDKIVESKEDAAFQAKCMGIFGMENRLLAVEPEPDTAVSLAGLPLLSPGVERELHLIVLDNDRTRLLQSEFKDLFLCIGCRTCNSACPAYLSGKPLRPRELTLNLKKHLSEVGSELLKEGGDAEAPPAGAGESPAAKVITEDQIWACTTCRACQEECPVEVKHTEAIIGLRQNLVMDQAVIPRTAEAALRSLEARGHPWRGTRFSRTDWAQGLGISTLAENSDVDILYWVGCTEALEDRGMKVAQATGKLLTRAGIRVGFLGAEETCCGDPARRLGNEYLFQVQAETNVKLLQRYNVRKIVTACPHCYNTLKNEYPRFGGEFEVVHHTQLIADLLREPEAAPKEPVLSVAKDSSTALRMTTHALRMTTHALRMTSGTEGESQSVTYHDPCYLGRYNGVYDPPRQILSNLPGITLVEMEQNRQRSFCCGGGGGRMWLEEGIGRRISELRIGRAIETKARTVVTACPFCLQMFDDAIKAKGVEESIKVMDIAELVNDIGGRREG
ncbi:MAG: 4Fe-4S dicluster domain-containing protein [Chloroflexi bacterium]|nr:4Fe-4S dicluster domain-containing protein [Chloroflexota bacterium]